ncbi:CarD family transcriptional regulator [Paenibacillus sp. FSL E2-0178]|uniref:CarD family transcriptional regulator n=1 Tax=Paenibacillus sp. FSL E2-0178 TaxID=2921361 RepID=UPI003158B95C
MKPGEPVFYPLNGVGIFDSEVKRIFMDDTKAYYKVYFPLQKMTMFIPKDKEQKKGIRPLSTLEYLHETRKMFFEEFSRLPVMTSERHIILQERIESGDVTDVVTIIRDLICSPKYNLRLNGHDKYMLTTACDMLAHELMYAADISMKEAQVLIKKDIDLRLAE